MYNKHYTNETMSSELVIYSKAHFTTRSNKTVSNNNINDDNKM